MCSNEKAGKASCRDLGFRIGDLGNETGSLSILLFSSTKLIFIGSNEEELSELKQNVYVVLVTKI